MILVLAADMKRNRLLLSWHVLAGLLVLATVAEGLKGTALVISKLKQKPIEAIAESRSSDEQSAGSSTDGSTGVSAPGGDNNATTKSPLTGIPQKDYIHDLNLPRELNGYNLTEYPFYERVPDEIDFKCDGLHDGFYASIIHKCQVYHHCLFGTRYDFLCANYTAFDQKTFICHFVSEVDCINSPKYFKRNEALYKEATTTTTTVATTTTAATQPPPPARRQPASAPGPRRRRPYRRRRPVYDYYYDDDYEDAPEYYDDELPVHRTTAAPPPSNGRRRKRPRPQRPLEEDRRQPGPGPSAPYDQEDPQPETDTKPRPSTSLYDRPRVPPKIRRPVPLNERDKYEYTTRKPAQDDQETYPRLKPQTRPQDDYYDDEEDYAPQARNPQGSSRAKNPEYYPASAADDRDVGRRPTMTGAGRPLRRNRPSGTSRRRPVDPAPLEEEADDYDLPYEQRRPMRPSGGRKRPQQDDYYRPSGQPSRQDPEYAQPQRQASRYENEPVPAPRPAYISTAPGNNRPGYRKRVQQTSEAPVDEYAPPRAPSYRRPAGTRKPPARQPTTYSDEEDGDYYDEEEPQQNYRGRQKGPAGPYRQPEPLPAPPPAKTTAEAEEESVIVPPQRSTKRPFLPSRGGNPTLPRGLQPLGSKSPQPGLKPAEVSEERPSRVPQPLMSSNYRPKLEDDYEEDAPLKQGATRGGSPPNLSDALTSRPIAQSSYKSGVGRGPQSDLEDLPPRRGQSGEYRTKVEEVAPRQPLSASGSFRTKQSNISDRGANSNKYRQSETIPSLAPPVSSPTPSNYRTKNEDISQAKTSPPLANIRGDTSRQQPPEEPRPVPPSAAPKPAPSVVVYRTPVKPPGKPSAIPPPEPPPRTNLADIDESEYDVTLNDALHPTLHPTRSVSTGIAAFPPQPNLQRVQVFKTKLGPPARRAPEGVEPSSTGTASRGYLVSSASQRQVTRAPYDSLTVHAKDGQLAYLHQQEETVQYNPQQSRNRRPVSQYEDDLTPPVAVNPTRYTQVETQYQRGVPLLVADDAGYSNDRQRQTWGQPQRREPLVEYVAQY